MLNKLGVPAIRLYSRNGINPIKERQVSERAMHLEQVDRSKIVVVLPAYNEERFIGSTVIKTRQYADTVIVVDDGSIDDTAEIAQTAGAIVVSHSHNMGKGVALSTGFGKALELNPTVIVTLDGDGQHVPQEMTFVVAPILRGEADIVVGSRYLENRSKVPTHRILGHWVFTSLTNIFSGVSITDSQSGFRAFSPKALQSISFSSNGFSVESEMQFLAREHHLRMAEVPITIHYKDKPKRSVVGQGLIVLDGVLRFTGQYRPLLFFGLPGLALLLVGVIWGVWVVEIYRDNHVLAVGYAMICMLLAILGSLILFTGFTLHSVRELLVNTLGSREAKR